MDHVRMDTLKHHRTEVTTNKRYYILKLFFLNQVFPKMAECKVIHWCYFSFFFKAIFVTGYYLLLAKYDFNLNNSLKLPCNILFTTYDELKANSLSN